MNKCVRYLHGLEPSGIGYPVKDMPSLKTGSRFPFTLSKVVTAFPYGTDDLTFYRTVRSGAST